MRRDPLLDAWMRGVGSAPTSEDFLYLLSQVRDRDHRAAIDAVAAMPLHSFPDGGLQAALVFRDGWATGYTVGYNDRDAEILDMLSMISHHPSCDTHEADPDWWNGIMPKACNCGLSDSIAAMFIK